MADEQIARQGGAEAITDAGETRLTPARPADTALSRLAKLWEVWRIAKQRAAEGHLPVARQVPEMIYLYLRNGLSPT